MEEKLRRVSYPFTEVETAGSEKVDRLLSRLLRRSGRVCTGDDVIRECVSEDDSPNERELSTFVVE